MKVIFLSLLTLIIIQSSAKDWSNIDFFEDYKFKVRLKGKADDDMAKYPTFINKYSIGQATVMSGSDTKGERGIFSEINLVGINRQQYFELTNKLYLEFVAELNSVGLKIVEGNEFLQTEYVQDQIQDNDDKEFVGKLEPNQLIVADKAGILEGSIPLYPAWAVKEDVRFYPEEKNVYFSTKTIPGNFYFKAAKKSETNLLSIDYNITFASFDSDRGYKSRTLNTNAVIAINVTGSIISARNGYGNIYFDGDAIWGSGNWVEYIGKTKDNKNTAEFLGIARSAEYIVEANPEKFINEVYQIISNLQKAIAKGIKDEMQ